MMIEKLRELLAIESVAQCGEGGLPYGPGPAAALEYVLNLCGSFGFTTKNAEGKYGYAEIGSGKELIGILCHLDVVPAGKGWDYPPFAGTLKDGRLYGRGALDDKGPTVACIFAMKDLLDAGTPLKKRIRIIFGQTEENGEWTDIEEYKRCEELPSYGFTPDGDFPALYGEKGILLIKLSMPLAASGFLSAEGGSAPNMVPDLCRVETEKGSFSAEGKAAHGSAPWTGINAIAELMEKLAAEEGCGELPFVRMYRERIGRCVHGEKMGCAFCDEESGELSMNAGLLKTEGENLELYLDIRYPVTFSEDDVLNAVDAAVSPYGASAEVIHRMRPVYMDKDGPVMRRLLAAYRNVTGDLSEPLVIGGGTYARSMDNIIAFGPNIPGHPNTEHEKNEYITIEDFEAIREIYRQALEALVHEQIL